jgi:Xaa-Pro aminopeptidase
MNLHEIQQRLQAENLDGWLFFDHHVRDPIAYRVLGLEPCHVSRRWYYWLPAVGEPHKLVHRIEAGALDTLPGQRSEYSGWREQHERLRQMLRGASRLAMQYSPNCMIPYVALVDAGTIELVRAGGIEIVSSAALVQYFDARWTDQQLESHREAARRMDAIRQQAFQRIGSRLRQAESVSEFEVAQFIRDRFAESGLVAQDGPIVATTANSNNPHYLPTASRSAPIQVGDLVLIDMWAKLDRPRAVYYDITWMGFCGDRPPDQIQHVFQVVREARDRALKFVNDTRSAGRTIAGYEVDDVARGHIRAAGFGEAFVHRTGHSIGEEVHGNGANMDNLETHDERPVIARTCFSIEPGIYLPQFGVRSEIDCYVTDTDAAATGEVQEEIVPIA